MKCNLPKYGIFEITSNCNYNCIMCYNPWKSNSINKPSDLNKSDQIKVIEKLSNFCEEIVFTGGEPLSIDYIPELIAFANKKCLKTNLITNASLASKEKVNALRLANIDLIQVSLHSSISEIHNEICGFDNAFSSSINGINNFIKILGKEKIMGNMAVSKKNYFNVYDTGKLFYNLGISKFVAGSTIYSGACKSENMLNIDNLKLVYNQLSNLYQDFGMEVYFGGCIPFCIFQNINRENPVIMSKGCGCGKSFIAIGSDGNVRPCIEHPLILGNFLNYDVHEIWSHPFLEQFRDSIFAPPFCNDCSKKDICKGGCRISALNTDNKIDPYLSSLF